MSDDELMKGLARAAREQRDDAASAPVDEAANDRLARAALDAMGGAPVVPIARAQRRWSTAAFGAAAALAIAAGVLLYVRAGGPPPMPRYDVELVGGDQSSRSAPAPAPSGALTLRPDGYFEIRLRPDRSVGAPFEVAAALVRDGAARAWSAPIVTSPDGAVRIAGRARELFGDTTGEWTVVVAVGRTSTLPRAADAIARAEDAGRDDLRVYRVTVKFVP